MNLLLGVAAERYYVSIFRCAIFMYFYSIEHAQEPLNVQMDKYAEMLFGHVMNELTGNRGYVFVATYRPQ